MKIAGQEKGSVAEKEVQLSIGITLKLRGLPIGFVDSVREVLPDPPTKVTGYVRHRGKFIRDEEGRPIPEFADVSAIEHKINMLRTMVLLHEVLSGDPSVEFVTEKPEDGLTKDNAAEFAQGIYDEFEAFGIGMADFKMICEAMNELLGITDEEIEAARKGF